MPEFSDAIAALRISLERMATIRDEYMAEKLRFNAHDNEFAKERIFSIYSHDAVSIINTLLFRMELVPTDDDYESFNITTVLSNFNDPAKEVLIFDAFCDNYDKEIDGRLIAWVKKLTNEMQGYFDLLKETA